MFIWLTGLVVFVVFFALFLWQEGWCGEVIEISIMLGIIGLLLAFLASIIISFCVPSTAIGEVDRSELQLIALKDNMAVDGCLNGRYIYRGYIDEELQYTYLYKAKGKGITSGRCDADRTYINYTKDAEPPKLVTIEYNIIDPVWKFFSAANYITKASHRYEYYLYVPEGSIVAEGQYEVDLE
jgi:hypothetical protein